MMSLAACLALPQRPDGPGGRDGLPKDAPPVLFKVFRAAMKLRYSGERVVGFRHGPDRKQHVEYVLKDGQRIRIWFPDDSPMAGQVIVENGRDRRHFFPATNEVHAGPALHEDSFDKLRGFINKIGKAGLRYGLSPGEPVAGIRTTALTFLDPNGNPIQRLWIDERTGLMLKRELYDPAGGVAGSFEFTKINYNPVIRPDGSDFSVPATAKIVTQEDLARRLMKDSGMLTAFLDEGPGLRLMGSRVLGRDKDSKVLILTYQSGREPISLVQVRGTFEPDRLKRMARDQVSTYSWTLQGRPFALIGEMEEAQLRQLADRVRVR